MKEKLQEISWVLLLLSVLDSVQSAIVALILGDLVNAAVSACVGIFVLLLVRAAAHHNRQEKADEEESSED